MQSKDKGQWQSLAKGSQDCHWQVTRLGPQLGLKPVCTVLEDIDRLAMLLAVKIPGEVC